MAFIKVVMRTKKRLETEIGNEDTSRVEKEAGLHEVTENKGYKHPGK